MNIGGHHIDLKKTLVFSDKLIAGLDYSFTAVLCFQRLKKFELLNPLFCSVDDSPFSLPPIFLIRSIPLYQGCVDSVRPYFKKN